MFENFRRDLDEIEQKLVRLGIALNIDWEDDTRIALLAREAMSWHKADTPLHVDMGNDVQRGKSELFGMMQLILTLQEDAARSGMNIKAGKIGRKIVQALNVANVP